MNSCDDESGYGYKCSKCAFSKDGRLTCANPNIWEVPAKDAYFKSRDCELTKEELESIELRIN